MLKLFKNVVTKSNNLNNIKTVLASQPQQIFQVNTGYTSYQKRNLNVHEYIGIDLMRENNIAVPNGKVASSADEAKKIYESCSKTKSLSSVPILSALAFIRY